MSNRALRKTEPSSFIKTSSGVRKPGRSSPLLISKDGEAAETIKSKLTSCWGFWSSEWREMSFAEGFLFLCLSLGVFFSHWTKKPKQPHGSPAGSQSVSWCFHTPTSKQTICSESICMFSYRLIQFCLWKQPPTLICITPLLRQGSSSSKNITETQWKANLKVSWQLNRYFWSSRE